MQIHEYVTYDPNLHQVENWYGWTPEVGEKVVKGDTDPISGLLRVRPTDTTIIASGFKIYGPYDSRARDMRHIS